MFGLREETLKKICTTLARYPEVTEAILYGSRAMGTHHQGSDIDLTLLGDALTSDHLAKIANDLDDLLLPQNFDLSLFRKIDSQSLREHIQRVGKVIFTSAGERN